MTLVRQNILGTVMLKNDKLSNEMSDCIWQHQKYASKPRLLFFSRRKVIVKNVTGLIGYASTIQCQY